MKMRESVQQDGSGFRPDDVIQEEWLCTGLLGLNLIECDTRASASTSMYSCPSETNL